MNNDEKRTSDDFSLEALRAGDKAEFARLVDTYSALIYRLGLKMLQDEQDAEDVLQETFLKAYRHLATFDGRSSLSTWLYRIAANEALMLLRKRKQVVVSLDEPLQADDHEQEPLQIVDWCCLPENELMTSEARAVMDQAVEKLPPSLRVVFLLRDIEGMSTREVSEALQISEMAVKTRLSRARLQLRERLSEYYGERLRRQKLVEEGAE